MIIIKNSILTLVIFMSLCRISFTQQDCQPCSATLTMDGNSLLTNFIPQGITHQQKNTTANAPSLLGHANLWIGATDPNGNFKFAGDIPDKDGSDFYPGPLDYETGLTDFETCQNWDRFFLMTREIILDHDRLYNKYVVDQGIRIPDDSISIYLKSWPANSNPYFEDVMGFKLPNNGRAYASFHDESGTGSYLPSYGDFPIVFGYYDCWVWNRQDALDKTPDEFAYWIFNDVGAVHSNSQTDHLNVEISGMAFTNDTDGIVGQSIVQSYKIVNRGIEELRNVSVGLNINPKLGCSEDDSFGVEPDHNLFYSYNKDSTDGDENCLCADEDESLCEEIPMHGIMILDKIQSLKQTVISSDGDTTFVTPQSASDVDTFLFYDISKLNYHTVCIDSSIGQLDNCLPQVPEEYYELMKGNFSDATPVTYGGTGYNPGSTDSTSFVFPHAPDSSNWSMCSDQQPDVDYRPIMSMGPFVQYPNQPLAFSYVSFFVDHVDHPCPSLEPLLEAADNLNTYHQDCFIIERDDELLTSTEEVINSDEGFDVFPSPFSDRLTLEGKEQLKDVQIYDNIGRLAIEVNSEEVQAGSINTVDLHSGVYFIRINHNDKLYKVWYQLISAIFLIDFFFSKGVR